MKTLLVFLVMITGTVVPAIPAVAGSPVTLTCNAYMAWHRHHRMADLDVMLTASEHAPWRYVGQDAAALYINVRDHSRYVSDSDQYMFGDCHGYGA